MFAVPALLKKYNLLELVWRENVIFFGDKRRASGDGDQGSMSHDILRI